MRRLAILAVALSVITVGFVGTAEAGAASPAWWACEKTVPKNTGHFSDKACSTAVESGGKYELQPGIGKGKAFKGKDKTGGRKLWIVAPVGEADVECAAVAYSGHVAAPNRVTGASLAFSKCELFGGPCTSFTTPALSGELGWLNKAKEQAGVSLTDEAEPGVGYIAQFSCQIGSGGPVLFRIHGAFVGEQLGDVGVLSATATTHWVVHEEQHPEGSPKFDWVNQTGFEEGPVGVLETEINSPESKGAWVPEGGYRSGLESDMPTKGESLSIQ